MRVNSKNQSGLRKPNWGYMVDISCLISLLLFVSPLAYGHGGETHNDSVAKEGASPESDLQHDAIASIQSTYKRSVEKIFRASCFDCHSDQTHYPWYYKIPGVKQLMDSDVTEARKHLDMSDGFPFKGHGEPLSDLTAISEAVSSESMPPWRYEIMHKSAELSEQERAILKGWIDASAELLMRADETQE